MKKSFPLSFFGSFIFLFLLLSTFSNAQTQTVFTDNVPGTKTWRVPCDVTSIKVEVWGAGGRGGSRTNGSGSGGGATGGNYAGTTKNINVDPGTNITYSVGYGGGNGSRINGDPTTFSIGGIEKLKALGGPGVPDNTSAGAPGHVTPIQIDDVIQFIGGQGYLGNSNGGGGGGSSAGIFNNGNNGGGTSTQPYIAGQWPGLFGVDGNYGGEGGKAGSRDGWPGGTPGGGGGGGFSGGATRPGGKGGNGQIRITYTSSYKTNYCTKSFAAVEPITLVKFAGIDNGSSALLTSPAHEYFCGQATVKRGEGYPISIKGNTNEQNGNNVRVYIDWNKDGIYQDTEKYDLGILAKSNGTDSVVLNSFISIPTDAPLGLTKMRVVKGLSITDTDPCAAGAKGQAEEYTINILAADACKVPFIATASNITHTSAILNWVARYNTTATSYDVEWSDNPNFTGSNLTSIATGFKHAITGLTTGTTYYYRVRAKCTGSTQSAWTETESFVTGKYTPIDLTGFTEDVIANGAGKASETTTSWIDNSTNKHVLAERGYFLNNDYIKNGLPRNRVIKNADGNVTPSEVKYYLQDYSLSNSLRLDSTSPQTLSLTEPMAYQELYIAGTTGQASIDKAKLKIEVVYDSGPNTIFNETLKDWFDGTPYIFATGSRVKRQDGNVEYLQDNPRIYQLKLSGLDSSRKVREVKFTNTNGSAEVNIAHIFAISGLNACAKITVEKTNPNVCVQGTKLLASSLEDTTYNYTWAPLAGLFTDEALTIAYTGGNSNQVYAMPSETSTYTLTATSANGCIVTQPVVVEGFTKTWIGNEDANWANPNNWTENSIPAAINCVKINSSPHLPIISTGTNAFAKTLSVATGGKLTIQNDASLTVTDFVQNNAGESNFIIESGGSLVQKNDSAVNIGKITAKRDFIFSTGRQQYNYVISPVIGQGLKGIFSEPSTVIRYNESNSFFYNSNGNYVAGQGFGVKEPANGNGNATFTGVPANGEITFPIKKSGSDYGYNLTGNPYPSSLDLDIVYKDNMNVIEPTFHFWDNRGNTVFTQYGSGYNGNHYATFNAVSPPGTGTGVAAARKMGDNGTENPTGGAMGNPKTPNQFAAVSTAFMVRLKTMESDPLPATGTLVFNNAQRATGVGIDFAGKTDFNPSVDRYWLTMKTPDDLVITTAIVYFEGGTNGLGIEDSESFGGSDAIYSLVDENQLVIQGKAPFTIKDKVPLGYAAFKLGIYIISLNKVEGVFANGQNIYLRDKVEKVIYNLSQADYKFISEPGEFNKRFELIYMPYSLTDDASNVISNKVNIELKDKNIVATSSEHKITKVVLYDLNNRPIYQSSEINSLVTRIPFANFANQIAIISLETETGEVVNKKLILR